MTNFIRRLALAMLCAGVALGADENSAQKAATSPAKARPDIRRADPAAFASMVRDAWQRRIPDLAWDNLPLGAIIQELRMYFPEINFLVKNQTDMGDAVDVSSISVKLILKAVTLSEILKAIELAADRPVQITGAPEERLVVFERRPVTGANDLPAPELGTRVFSLRKYLENRSEKETVVALREIEDVIRMAGAVMNDATKGERTFNPRLSIHPGTKLLIVVGYPTELALVENIVTQLPNAPASGTVGSIRELKPGPDREPPAGKQ